MALPFGLLSAVLFLRSWTAIFSVPFNLAVWFAAEFIECDSSQLIEPYINQSLMGYTLAGAVGALGVILHNSASGSLSAGGAVAAREGVAMAGVVRHPIGMRVVTAFLWGGLSRLRAGLLSGSPARLSNERWRVVEQAPRA